jgi:iron(III) transport system permease protein
MGWLFLLHPRIGLLNRWAELTLGRQTPVLDVATVPGMGIVQGLGLAGLVFVLTATNLRASDASLEEAAMVSGAGPLQTAVRIVLPLSLPALLAAALFSFVVALSVFDVPLVVGLSNRIYVFSTYIYTKTNPTAGLPDYGLSAAFACVMIGLSVGLSMIYSRVLIRARRYQVVSGRGYRPRVIRLGRWTVAGWGLVGIWLLLAEVLPALTLVWSSFQPFLVLPSEEALQTLSLRNYESMPFDFMERGLAHTAVVTIAVPTLAVLASLVMSWATLRSRSRLRLAFDFASFLPFAVPSVIFGYAAIVFSLFLLPPQLSLYGSLPLLIAVMALVQVSFGTRMTTSALVQISTELEDAGYISGATARKVVRRIVLPLLRPTLAFAWVWLAMLAFRELTLPTMLFSPDNFTLSVVIWSRFSTGFIGQASAITVVTMALLLPLVALYWRFASTPDRPLAA